jgi:hypothetical protein
MPPLQLCSYRQATSVAGFPFHSRKRSPPATRRRALELLVRSPDGMGEAMLRAHGFTVEILVDLVQAGLATAKNDGVVAGGRPDQRCPHAEHGSRPAGAPDAPLIESRPSVGRFRFHCRHILSSR